MENDQMGEEADADWQDGLVEWGREDANSSILDQAWRRERRPDRRCAHGKLFTESCPGCGYIHPRDAQS
jgi:hypothetical protein